MQSAETKRCFHPRAWHTWIAARTSRPLLVSLGRRQPHLYGMGMAAWKPELTPRSGRTIGRLCGGGGGVGRGMIRPTPGGTAAREAASFQRTRKAGSAPRGRPDWPRRSLGSRRRRPGSPGRIAGWANHWSGRTGPAPRTSGAIPLSLERHREGTCGPQVSIPERDTARGTARLAGRMPGVDRPLTPFVPAGAPPDVFAVAPRPPARPRRRSRPGRTRASGGDWGRRTPGPYACAPSGESACGLSGIWPGGWPRSRPITPGCPSASP